MVQFCCDLMKDEPSFLESHRIFTSVVTDRYVDGIPKLNKRGRKKRSGIN